MAVEPFVYGSDEIIVVLLLPTEYLKMHVVQLPISLLQHRLLLFHVSPFFLASDKQSK